MTSNFYINRKMRLIVLFVFYFSLVTSFAQSPDKFSYQAVVRNGSGVLVQSSNVGFKISLLQGSTSGTVVYSETQVVGTNANGLATLEIGGGTVLSGNFATIDWSTGPYFLKSETDPAGGTSYTIAGISQLLSVPYSLYSKTAGNGFSGSFTDLNNKPTTIEGYGITNGITTSGNQSVAGSLNLTGTLGVTGKAGIGTFTPASSAALDVSSANQGFLPPRMTYTQKMNIYLPVAGLTIWCSDCATNGELQVYNGTIWTNMIGGSASTALPVLTTTPLSSIKSTTAASGGEITSDGGANVTGRGVCWNISLNPTIANNKTTDGTGTGVFTSQMTGLTQLTKYYVRAYATTSTGTGYGNEFSFTTPAIVLPTVTTSVSLIGGTTVTSGGNVSDDGGDIVTTRGVCWSTSANPTIANSITTDGTGTGIFISSITGLTTNTSYFIRAYAANSAGTAYGNEISVKTATVSIGDSYQGGIVAYILQPGDPGYDINVSHGLIAATADQGTGIQWYNGTNILTGATGTAIGTGSLNTTTIIASQGNTGTYAAKVCRDYTGGGYSDWHLPSRDELSELYLNKTVIGGFTTITYWSSSEYSLTYVWAQYFAPGTSPGFYNPKNLTTGYSIRAIRSF